MKPRLTNILTTASICFAAVTTSQAELYKANNTDALTAASSWEDFAGTPSLVAPSTTENLIWDSRVTGTGLYSFGNGQFTGGVTILNPGGLVQLRVASNGTTTWANNALIDMSSADLVNTEWVGGAVRIDNGNYNPTFNVASGRTLTIGGNGVNNRGNTKTFTFAGAGNIIINANSGGGGAMNFNVNGPTVTMNNATSGWTFGTVTSGKLVLGNATTLDGKAITVNVAAGLDFGTGITSATLGSLAGNGDIALTNADTNAVNLVVGGNNSSQTYSGSLTGVGGSLTKNGSGSLTLSGGASDFTGGIALNAGTITIGNSNATAGGTITAADATFLNLANSSSIFPGGTVSVSGAASNVTLTSANISAGFGFLFTGLSDQTVTIAGTNQVNISSGNTKQFNGFPGTVAVASGATLRFSSSSLNNGGDNTTFDLTGNVVTRNNGFLALGALSGNGNLNMGGSGPNTGQLFLTIGAKGVDTTYGGVISDADTANGKLVSVTKTGGGIQTFTGANAYTGKTTVSQGTLSISNPYLADTSTVNVNLAASAVLNLNFTGGDFVTGFEVDGGTLSDGVYGATGNTNPAITGFTDAISGPGLLYVNTPLPSGGDYETWADIYTPADLTNMAGDNDNDGLTNQQEYAYGLSPVSGSSVNPITVQLNKSTGTFTYQRRATTGLTYKILTSTNLVTWTENTPTSALATPIAATDNESVAVTLSGLPLPAKFFVRVAAD